MHRWTLERLMSSLRSGAMELLIKCWGMEVFVERRTVEWLVVRSWRSFSLHVEWLGVLFVVFVSSFFEAEVAKVLMLLSLHVHVVLLWVEEASILVVPV